METEKLAAELEKIWEIVREIKRELTCVNKCILISMMVDGTSTLERILNSRIPTSEKNW